MSRQAKVIWSEGMLLRQQHFQQQERYLQYLIAQSRTPDLPERYGFQQYSIAKPLLSLLRFTLEQANGIFPDGTPFTLGDTALLEPLSVPADTVDQLIYLCLPLQQNQREEVSSAASLSHRYRSEILNLPDASSDNGSEAPVVIGKLNLQLRLAQDNLTAFTLLPIAKIKYCDEQEGIVLDETYIPPLLTYPAASSLQQGLQEITGLLEQRIKALALRVANPSHQNIADLNEWLILQTLNRHVLSWQHMLKSSQMHPLYLYQAGLQLLGELSTFTTPEKYWDTPIPYQQDDLAQTFNTLFKALRLQLNKAVESAAFAIPLEKTEQGWWISPVLAAELIERSKLILAVKASIPQEELQKRFPSQTKLAASDQIAVLVRSQLPGLGLELLPTVPPAIPYHAGFTYFAVEYQPALWINLTQSGQLAIHVAGQFPNLEMQCWAVRS